MANQTTISRDSSAGDDGVIRKTLPDQAGPASDNWITLYIGNLKRISKPARAYLLGTTLVGMAWATFMLLFNLYMRERGFSEGVIGQVLSMQSFGMVSMAIPAAMLVSRRSARGMLVVASLGVAAGFTMQTLADAQTFILGASFITGAMLAVSRVIGAPFLMSHSTTAERTHVFSLSFAAMLGSGLVTHFAAGSLHDLLMGVTGSSLSAYRWVLLTGCSCAVLGSVAFSRVPSGVVGQRDRNMGVREFWNAKGKLLFKLTFPFFLVGMGAGLIIPFLNLYFQDRFSLTPQTIGVYYGLVQASMIVGVLIGPELARRWGMVRTVVVTEWASLPFMLVLAFTDNLPLATLAFLMRGALMNLGVPISNNYMMERVGQADRALVNSWSMIAWSLSWAVTTAIGGVMIEHGGYVLPLLLACGLYVASSLMYFVYFRKVEIYAGRPATTGGVRPADE
ncbi:MAG: MFS transporter [Candidatus Zixiibacteriota bacterium]